MAAAADLTGPSQWGLARSDRLRRRGRAPAAVAAASAARSLRGRRVVRDSELNDSDEMAIYLQNVLHRNVPRMLLILAQTCDYFTVRANKESKPTFSVAQTFPTQKLISATCFTQNIVRSDVKPGFAVCYTASFECNFYGYSLHYNAIPRLRCVQSLPVWNRIAARTKSRKASRIYHVAGANSLLSHRDDASWMKYREGGGGEESSRFSEGTEYPRNPHKVRRSGTLPFSRLITFKLIH